MINELPKVFFVNQGITIIYACILIFHYHYLPIVSILPEECIQSQNISKELANSKNNYINQVGMTMILTNLLIILTREMINFKKTSFYSAFSEVYLFNILFCVFVLKRPALWIMLTVTTIFSLNWINIFIRRDIEFFESIVSSINGCIISGWIMVYCQRESDESYESKKLIMEKKQMLRKILKLFPFGIIFYSQKEGIFYKNKFWMNLLEKYNKSNYKFWRNRSHQSNIINQNSNYQSAEEENLIGNTETQKVLGSMYSRENTNHTLKDEILKIHNHFYHKNVEFNKIDEYGVDNFIHKENIDFNEYEIKDKRGNQIAEFNVKFSAFKFTPDDKSVMVVINDISERAKLRESKISEMLKTIMLCSISHELRSPVNQINGALTLLLPTLSTNKQKDLLKIANSSTELLKLKINDMLDFYEVETNNFKAEKKFFKPTKLFSYIKKVFFPMFDKNCQKLYFQIHEGTPELIYHDMERIRQVLINFISNSIKYTKRGVIWVSIDWKADLKSPCHGNIKFSVSDTGVGVPKSKREHLFKFLDPNNFKNPQFWKEWDSLFTPRLAGTGLGISQKIVQALGSTIEFTSAEGAGSVFWFTLKINPVDEVQSAWFASSRHIMEDIDLAKNCRSAEYDIKYSSFNNHLIKRCSSNQFMPDNPYDLFDIDHMQCSDELYLDNPKNNAKEAEKTKESKLFLNKFSKIREENEYFQMSKQDFEFEKDIQMQNYEDFIPDEEPLSIISFPLFVENAANLSFKSHSSHWLKDINEPLIDDRFTFPDLLREKRTCKQRKLINDSQSEIIKPKSCQTCSHEEIKTGSNSLIAQPSIRTTKQDSLDSIFEHPKESAKTFKSKFWKADNNNAFSVVSNDSLYPNITPEEINPIFKKACNCPSVLIVDDQYINRFIIKEFWEEFEIVYSEAKDGQEAIDIVIHESRKSCCQGFELILMDLNMPILGGIEAVQKIKKLKSDNINPKMKIVAVTAFPSKSEKQKWGKAGFSKFIVKPFTIDHFISLIRK
jgi:signal transduction histidine kinase